MSIGIEQRDFVEVQAPLSVGAFAVVAVLAAVTDPQRIHNYLTSTWYDVEHDFLSLPQKKIDGLQERSRSLLTRITTTKLLADLLLDEDNRGDRAVFDEYHTYLPYSRVRAMYLGDEVRQSRRAEYIDNLVQVSTTRAKSLEQTSAENMSLAIDDFTTIDHAMATLIVNEGNRSGIPNNVWDRMKELGVLSKSKLERSGFWLDKGDYIRWYRDWENRLFVRALLALWHRGDMSKVERDIDVSQACQVLQVQGDKQHVEKNRHEPSYRALSEEVGSEALYTQEIRGILSQVQRRELRWLFRLGIPVGGWLSAMTGKRAEWDG